MLLILADCFVTFVDIDSYRVMGSSYYLKVRQGKAKQIVRFHVANELI